MSTVEVEITITPEGPMGLNVATAPAGGSVVHSVVSGGLADAAGVRAGDVLVRVGERDVAGAPHEAALDAIRLAGRPLRLALARAAEPRGVAAVTDAARAARAAGTKAAGLFKGLLGAAVSATVQGIKGVDKLLETTLDVGVKGAAVRPRADAPRAEVATRAH